MCLLFLAGSFSAALFPSPAAADTRCPASHIDQQARVKSVHDGDTLTLKNGDKIRLIGINAPEVARKSRPAEAFGNAARDYLRQRLPRGAAIELQFGAEKKDRYGRTLAHVFLPGGENIQAALLQQGLASTLAIPPNTALASCYRRIEQQARCDGAGLWSDRQAITESDQLTAGSSGFQRIKGRVERVEKNRQGVWLHLAGDVTVGIRPDNLALFDTHALSSLQGKTLLVRGWLNKSRYSRFYIRVRHPLAIERLDNGDC